MPTPRNVTISPQSMFLDTRMADGLVRAYHARNRQLASGAPSIFDPVEPADIPEEFYRDTSLQRRLILAARYGWLANPSWVQNVSIEGIPDALRILMSSHRAATTVPPLLRYLTWWYFRDGSGSRPSARLPLYDSRAPHANGLVQSLAQAAEQHGVPVDELEPIFSAFLPNGDHPLQSVMDMFRAARSQPFTSNRNLYSAARDAGISSLNLALVLTEVPEFSSDVAVASHFGAQADNIPRGMTLNYADVGKVFLFNNGGAFRISDPGEDRGDLLRVMHPVYTGDAAGYDPRVGAPATAGPAVVSYSASAISYSTRYWRFATEAEIDAAFRRPAILNGWYCTPQTNGGNFEDLMHNLGLSSAWSNSYSAGCRLVYTMFPNAASESSPATPAPAVPERSDPSPTVRSDVQPAGTATGRTTRSTLNQFTENVLRTTAARPRRATLSATPPPVASPVVDEAYYSIPEDPQPALEPAPSLTRVTIDPSQYLTGVAATQTRRADGSVQYTCTPSSVPAPAVPTNP